MTGPPDFTLLSSSPGETRELGRRLGERLRGGEVILLNGPLAAGKTGFTAGLAEGLGTNEPAISPTYILHRVLPAARGLVLQHFDFYRLEGPEDAEGLGLEEFLGGPNVTAVEWPERCPGALPEWTLSLDFAVEGDETRRIEGRWGTLPKPPGAWPVE